MSVAGVNESSKSLHSLLAEEPQPDSVVEGTTSTDIRVQQLEIGEGNLSFSRLNKRKPEDDEKNPFSSPNTKRMRTNSVDSPPVLIAPRNSPDGPTTVPTRIEVSAARVLQRPLGLPPFHNRPRWQRYSLLPPQAAPGSASAASSGSASSAAAKPQEKPSSN